MEEDDYDIEYLAGTVVGSREVPAVGVLLAGVASLRALVDIPGVTAVRLRD